MCEMSIQTCLLLASELVSFLQISIYTDNEFSVFYIFKCFAYATQKNFYINQKANSDCAD
jgi:hypothetical protein